MYSTEEIILDLQRLGREQPRLRFRVDKLISVITDIERKVLLAGSVTPWASRASIQTLSMRPIATEGIRQLGGWGGAFAGMRIGGMAGAAVGIETGPGAILTGAAGAADFWRSRGYFSADWAAEWSIK